MPYKPTGNPPGRPRKPVAVVSQTNIQSSETPLNSVSLPDGAKVKPLERAREGFRRAAGDPTADLHRPPRQGKRRKQEVSRRPILHPNVIRG
jgi:hypothetical protein